MPELEKILADIETMRQEIAEKELQLIELENLAESKGLKLPYSQDEFINEDWLNEEDSAKIDCNLITLH